MMRERRPPGSSRFLGLQVLYVEDDLDVQIALREVLEAAGYHVTIASTSAEGIAALESRRFHLVIADYNLPDGDGARMLATAAERGILRCESLILTGASRLDGVAGYRVVRKPVDVDKFLAKLDEILSPVRNEEIAKAKKNFETAMDHRPSGTRIELVLYVSESSSASLRAVRNLERLLALYRPEQVDVRVVDLSRERPASLDDDHITFTPTLVKRSPEPRVYFLGTLENIETLSSMLSHANVELRR
jgi:CheY-like chemotaxis protein